MKWWPFGNEDRAKPEPAVQPAPPAQRTPSIEEVLGDRLAEVQALARPRIRLVPSTKAGTAPAGRTKLGGLPDLPEGMEWPTLKGNPLAFVAQIDLEALSGSTGTQALPEDGLLLFFYDVELQYGFVDYGRIGYWQVVHATGPVSPRNVPSAQHEPLTYYEVKLSPVCDVQLPNPESLENRISIDKELLDEYYDAWYGQPGPAPQHQMLGFPQPIQNDPFEECQVEANALNVAGRKGVLDPAWPSLQEGVKDWRLLLQVDSDEDAGMMWGDVGMLYFCIRERDLEMARFDKVWMIFQCS
ncbi:MAG TPA: YwqG family protein [Fimbriimonadaceae bacterium]|nr:YwqG family protein [Fimbriimonadaceae bacterium]